MASSRKNKVNKDVRLNKDEENATLSDYKKIFDDLEGGLIKRIIPPEPKYVRRTAEQFAEGAKPVRVAGSHRMKPVSVNLIPEVLTASREEAERQGVKHALWMRAAARMALRLGLDVERELATEFDYEPTSDPYADNDPQP